MKFVVSSDDCELLLALEKAENLSELSVFIKRDISVLSRRLNKISSESSMLEKLNGKWILTEDGLKLNNWTKKVLNEQNLLFLKNKTIRIGTTREFAARILIPYLKNFNFSNMLIEIITSDGNSENLLLDNSIDVAIDCGTPYHPDIRFKKVVKEKMLVVASKSYFLKNKKFKSEDYLHFTRTDINSLQEELNLKLNPSFIFNDLSSLKAAILSNLGFGLIPYYVVQEELKNKTLYDYEINLKSPMSFGVWWRHDFKNKELINSLIDFLKKVEI
jgi:DNA-binding transcriptional LysR family regulator